MKFKIALDDAVELVVSGHTHSAYNCKLATAKGRKISVTSSSSFGRLLTDINLIIDPNTKDVISSTATNRLAVRNDPSVPANTTITNIINGYKVWFHL